MKKWLRKLIGLEEESPFRKDLNRGIASLLRAEESQHRPHLCLNGDDGIKVLAKIAQNPDETKTEFWIGERLICSNGKIWLNLHFRVFIEKICFPANVVALTPRQTSYIIENLPPGARDAVIAKITTWYFDEFLVQIKKGLDRITDQFQKGDLLIKDDEENRILDLHGGRFTNIPYTEWGIVGRKLWEGIFLRHCNSVRAGRRRRKGAVYSLMELIRAIGPRRFRKTRIRPFCGVCHD